jgi:hypothetical protein
MANETDTAPEQTSKPADLRLKLVKRFENRYLPKGELRDRWKAIRAKWLADESHTGVTLEELKALKADWAKARAARKPKAKV